MVVQKALFFVGAVLLATQGASGSQAQNEPAGPRRIGVAGVSVRVWTTGLGGRKPGQPVVVLEAGSGADLDTWKPVFEELARIAPVIAYE